MKRIVIIFTLKLALISISSAQPETMWQLLQNGDIIRWAYSGGDEFNDNNLDNTKWMNSYPWGRNYSGTCSQEYMTDDLNFEFGYSTEAGGNTIKLIAKEEDVYARGIGYEPDDYLLHDGLPNLRWWHYTSGMLFSKQKFKYGLFEIRCKLPEGKGLWPAFWLFGGNPNEEFDIFEYKGETPNKIHYDVHCPDGCDNYNGGITPGDFGGWVTANGNLSDGFNIIRGEWANDYCIWGLNGDEFAIWIGNFNYQAHLIANLGVANDSPCPFDPGPDNTTQFPISFEIDYIRVWTRLDCEQQIVLENYNQNNTQPTVITGNQITFGGNDGNAIILSGQYLKSIATNNIVLKPGFFAETGSYFSASIVECPGPYENLNLTQNNGNLKIKTDTLSPKVKLNKQDEASINIQSLYTKVYPNPTDGIIEIEFAGQIDVDMKIEILSTFGVVMFKKNNIKENRLKIDISSYPKGAYYLKGTFGNSTIRDKIILK